MAKLTPELKAEVQDVAKRSLWWLCTEGLRYKDWDVVHDDLERFMCRRSRRKAILLPRGHLKSSIITIGWTIQQILRNPDIRILIGNQVWDMSRKFLREIKEQFEKSDLKYFFGEFRSEKWNEDEIIIKQRSKAVKEPTILTTGVEAETTGGHFDIIILDDLMGRQNSQTHEQREKAKVFRRGMLDLLEPEGTLIEIGTRWHLDDTFSELFEKESKYYDIMVRTVVEGGKVIFPKKFNKRFNEDTKSFDNVGFTCLDFIDHLRATHTSEEFSAQYMNNPVDEKNQLFKKGYFQYYTKRPETYKVMCVDLAISQRTYSDYTAIVVVGMDEEGKVYVLDYLRGKWSPRDIVSNVFQMQGKWKPNTVGMEVNGFQKTLKLSCEEHMRKERRFFPIEEIRSASNVTKEYKIKSLEPFYRDGLVYHHETMRGKDLENELLTFPKGKHDDMIDALSMTLPYLIPLHSSNHFEIPVGSWEYVVRQTNRMNKYKDFYNYG